jgi:ketosteroid isomerase-like protein
MVTTMTDEDEVLAANAAFYAAFAASDVKAMDGVWARRAPVACVHPGWEALVGRDRVMESWRRILRGGASPISCSSAVAHLLGEAAFVTCLERVPGTTLIATNFFVREDGRFRMVHHHAGPAARPQAAPAPPRTELN